MAIILAERATIEFGADIKVDGYRIIETGEFRVGIAGVSTVLGYAENWLYRLHQNKSTGLKALLDEGYENLPCDVSIADAGKGKQTATTISLHDFKIAISYASFHTRKKQAQALAKALMGVSLDLFFESTFNKDTDLLEKMQPKFSKSYIDAINWSECDRVDWDEIDNYELAIFMDDYREP